MPNIVHINNSWMCSCRKCWLIPPAIILSCATFPITHLFFLTLSQLPIVASSMISLYFLELTDVLQPAKVGFRCHDRTLSMPYVETGDELIPLLMLLSLAFAGPAASVSVHTLFINGLTYLSQCSYCENCIKFFYSIHWCNVNSNSMASELHGQGLSFSILC